MTSSVPWSMAEHDAVIVGSGVNGLACGALLRTADANAHELGPEWHGVLESFFPNADLAFGVLGTELWSRHGIGLATRAYRRLGRRGALEFSGGLLVSARDWLETTFASERA